MKGIGGWRCQKKDPFAPLTTDRLRRAWLDMVARAEWRNPEDVKAVATATSEWSVLSPHVDSEERAFARSRSFLADRRRPQCHRHRGGRTPGRGAAGAGHHRFDH